MDAGRVLLLRGEELLACVDLDELPASVGAGPGCALKVPGEGVPADLGVVRRSSRGSLRYFPPEGDPQRLRAGQPRELPGGEGLRLLAIPGRAGAGPSASADLLDPVLELLPRVWEADPEDPPLLAILETLRQALRASWGAFARWSEDGGAAVVCEAGVRPEGAGGALSRTVLAELEGGEAPVLQAEVHGSPSLAAAASIPSEVRSILAARLTHAGGEEGLVYLESPASLRRYGPAEARLLEDLCALVAGELARARQASSERARSRRLGALYRLGQGPEPVALVAESPPMKALVAEVEKVGPTPTTVLLTGETGTGKERIARAIHRASPRGEEPFVPVNCAAIPAQLVESYLFGHVPGAFTDAGEERAGVFELAAGGTLLLDEVAELPLEVQATLLRVLEERRVVPVGAAAPRDVDVRLVAATHADLAARVEAGTFREDLYFRLAVFRLDLPPLRARHKCLPELAAHLLADRARRHSRPSPALSDEAVAALKGYAWPGNVRELGNVLEQALIRREPGEEGPLRADELGLPADRGPALVPGEESVDLATARAAFERDWIRRVLEEERTVEGALERLGIAQSSLYSKCKAYDIDLRPYRKR